MNRGLRRLRRKRKRRRKKYKNIGTLFYNWRKRKRVPRFIYGSSFSLVIILVWFTNPWEY